MTSFLLYLLKANLVLLLLYGFYRVFLHGDTFYSHIRWYLLTTIIATVFFPLIDLSDRQIGNVASTTVSRYVIDTEEIYRLLFAASPTENISVETATTTPSGIDFGRILTGCAIAGTIFLLMRKLLQSASLIRLTARSRKQYREKQVFFAVGGNTPPFSFFGRIFFNPSSYTEEESAEILAHERVHCRQMHTADILLAEIAVCLCWMNPAARFLRNDLVQNLEYYTDRRILQAGFDRKHYQYNLLRVSGNPFRIVNHFHFNHLKKRIIMMNKKDSPHILSVKYLSIIPILTAVLLLTQSFNSPSVKELASIVTPKISELQTTIATRSTETLLATEQHSTGAKTTKLESVATIKGKTGTDKTDTTAQIPRLKIETNGNNQPLILIDGKEVSDSVLHAMDHGTIESVTVLKDRSATILYGNKAANGVVVVVSKDAARKIIPSPPPSSPFIFSDGQENRLVIVDGKEASDSVLQTINPKNVESIAVLKDRSTTALYGLRAAAGVVVVTLKKGESENRTIPDYRIRQGVSENGK